MANINSAGQSVGLSIDRNVAPKAMLIPVAGLCVGLLLALLHIYRKSRTYEDRPIQGNSADQAPTTLQGWQIVGITIALLTSLGLKDRCENIGLRPMVALENAVQRDILKKCLS